MADYKTPQWLLPNEKNLAYPAAGDGITGSGLSEDRHSLYSMDFNGTDYISAPNTFLNSASVCTLSFWMKGTGEVGGGAPWNGIQIQAGATTTSFRTMNGSNINNYVSFSPGTDWHHYLGVYVGGSYSKLYIDGVLKSTLSTGIPATLASTSGDIFKIGYGQSYSVAKIDEVALWNRQLTDGGVADGATAGGEIATIYNSGSPGNLMGLSFKPIAYYPLGEQAQMGSANWSFPNGSLQSHVVDFDGSTDSIGIPETIYSGAFTFSFWLKPDNLTLAFIAGDINSNSNFIWLQSSTIISLKASGSTYNFTESAGNDITTGSWQNITITRDSSNNVEAFRNGVPFGGTSVLAGDFKLNSIGQVYSAIGNWLFNGLMSNIAIWNSDQSTNIDNIYNNGSPQSTYTATPTAWWKLNAANSSYVYPWSLELNGDPNVSGGGDHAKVVSNALEIRDIDSSGASTGTGGKVDFLTKEITGAYSGIDVTGEFVINTASSYTNGATLYYKIDGGSWVQFQQQLDTTGSATYAISGASGLTSTTSFQVKIEFETGNSGNSTVTLNNISIGGLYTEDFTNQDGAGWDNDTYTPPPVDWTFIDTETPAPNYTSALDFDGVADYVELDSLVNLGTVHTISWWEKSDGSDREDFIANPSSSSQIYGPKPSVLFYKAAGVSSYMLNGNAQPLNVNLNDDKWHNISIVRNGASLDFYIDGLPQVIGLNALVGTEVFEFNSIMHPTAVGRYSKGTISNLAVFTTNLSAANIITLYNNGTPQTSSSFSPTGWWKLNNTTTGIEDSAGSNNGTNNGATQIATNVLISNNGESDTLPTSALTPSGLQFESPYSNYSLSFDGTGNNLNLGDVQNNTSLTFSSWINTTSTNASSWQTIATNQSANAGYKFQYLLSGTNPVILHQIQHGGGASSAAQTTVAGFNDGNWHHFIFTYDGTNAIGAIKMYVDNVEVYSNPSTLTGSGIAASSSNLYLSGGATSAWFESKMDEVAIWGSALTQAQVSQVYNNGYPNNLTSLSPANWWRLGEDAYFVSNDLRVPNQITGGNIAEGYGTQTAMLVGDAPGSYANGSGTNLAVEDRIGDAPESTANSVSINMIPSNRISYPAGYTPTQVNNVYSMEFDGTSTKISFSDITLASSYTLSAWAKRTSSSNNEFLFGNGATYGYGAYFNGTTAIYFKQDSGNTTFNNTAITTALARTDWVNWMFVKDSTAGTISIYVDGTLAQSVTSALGMTSINTIGGDGTAATSYIWTGNIDEVAIFDYALSARQIKQDIYEGTTTGKTADLNNISNLTAPVAWYRMGD